MNLARFSIRWTAVCLVLASQPSRGGDGDGPELAPPAEMPNAPRPATPATSRPSVDSPGGRAVLAVPTIKPPVARPTNATTSPSPSLDPMPSGPSLEAPNEMKPAPSPARTRTSSIPDRSTRPLVLESTPMGEPDLPAPRPTPFPRRSAAPPQPVPVPGRRPRLFGLIPGTAPAPSIAPGRAAVENLREDPAPDSALKRRIEKQARDALGDRARSIEVKVVGKNAMVQAHGVKMFQKRNVRKSLESLPALSGLRSTIEVVD